MLNRLVRAIVFGLKGLSCKMRVPGCCMGTCLRDPVFELLGLLAEW